MKTQPDEAAHVDLLKDVDRTIHEPARLQILAYLAVVEEADFVFLKKMTGLTDGNLSSHLRKLEDAGYVEVEKKFVDRTPKTVINMSAEGRRLFEEYLMRMKRFVDGLQVAGGDPTV